MLLNQKQSPAGMVPLPALKVCGTNWVVGELPAGQPASADVVHIISHLSHIDRSSALRRERLRTRLGVT